MDFRIGINLGDIMIDDNDIFGDGVNVAARLEELTKATRVSILLSEETRRRLGEEIPCSSAGTVRVRGRTAPIAVFVPIAAVSTDTALTPFSVDG